MVTRTASRRTAVSTPETNGRVRRARLTEAEIVNAALELIAKVGVDGLTMRVLSERLGVALGATYKHVPNKQNLVEKVANRLLSSIESQVPEYEDWIGHLHVLFEQIYTTFRGYPGLVEHIALHSRVDTRPPQVRRALVDLLDGAGFSDDGVDEVLGALFFYTTGALLVETGQLGADPMASFAAGLDMLLWGAAQKLEHERARRRTKKAPARSVATKARPAVKKAPARKAAAARQVVVPRATASAAKVPPARKPAPAVKASARKAPAAKAPARKAAPAAKAAARKAAPAVTGSARKAAPATKAAAKAKPRR